MMQFVYLLCVTYQRPMVDPVIVTKYVTLNEVLSGLVDNFMMHCVLIYYDMYSSC